MPNEQAATARQVDANGWWEIKGNPLSLVGVFPYLGSKIPGAPDPTKFYSVYRPAEELADPDCLNSFKLVPWIAGHTMLGNNEEAGQTPAEEKGIGGVTGEEIFFDPDWSQYGGMRGNIKCFSSAHENLINSGVVELSLGYRCKYEYAPGVFNGTPYDYVQRFIRGNHVASVEDGRMGPQVAVLDSTDSMAVTFDSKEFAAMADEDKSGKGGDDAGTGTVDVKALIEQVEAIMPVIEALKKIGSAAAGGDTTTAGATDDDANANGSTTASDTPPPSDPAAADADADADKTNAAAGDADANADGKKDADAMDAMERTLAERNKRKGSLYALASPHVGAFDHSAMTERGMQDYVIGKLGLKVPAGAEKGAFLLGNLAGRPDPSKQRTAKTNAVAMDGADKKPGFITRQLTERK